MFCICELSSSTSSIEGSDNSTKCGFSGTIPRLNPQSYSLETTTELELPRFDKLILISLSDDITTSGFKREGSGIECAKFSGTSGTGNNTGSIPGNNTSKSSVSGCSGGIRGCTRGKFSGISGTGINAGSIPGRGVLTFSISGANGGNRGLITIVRGEISGTSGTDTSTGSNPGSNVTKFSISGAISGIRGCS